MTAFGSNGNATTEVGEPNIGGASSGRTVWWTWTAPTTGTVTIDTSGSSFDTVLGVYTGSSIASLSRIADNDDADYFTGVITSRVRFTAFAGETFQILVDGYLDASGQITLHIAV